LCSVIDQQTSSCELELVPVGLIGCDGPTDTVRLFSRTPITQLQSIACDIHSNTSVVLLQLILAQAHGVHPELTPFDALASEEEPEAMLLIGDKVVHMAPSEESYPHQLDLGEAWKNLTGLPFVFGAWFRRAEEDKAQAETSRQLAVILDHRRRHNRSRIESIIAREAPSRGWDVTRARTYLRERLRFAPTPERIEAIREFHRRAADVGVITGPRPLRVAEFT
jgi:chorismate dehydratase